MSVKVYVEGGGDTRELKQKCRRGFSEFFRKVGLAGRMLRVVSGGSRNNTYDRFRTALTNAKHGEFVVLLVDSEGPVAIGSGPWAYLKGRDGWGKPEAAKDENAHLMVQCMEAWFFADRQALAAYFGVGFNENALPGEEKVEKIAKSDLASGLKEATRQCKKKGKYHKGSHSFNILSQLNPDRVAAASPHAKRLIQTLCDKLS